MILSNQQWERIAPELSGAEGRRTVAGTTAPTGESDRKLTLMSATGRPQMVIDRYPGLRRM